MTKAALAADAAAREKLRREFLEIQEAVKQTEIAIPFVFYDGANIPGGTVNVKKGDHIWLFLDRCRKLGAELGVSGSGTSLKSREDSRKQWARVGVDDLMCVRGEVIVPHVSTPVVARPYIKLTYSSTTSSTISSQTRSLIRREREGFCLSTPVRLPRRGMRKDPRYFARRQKMNWKASTMIQP